jgi:hypothetical protein
MATISMWSQGKWRDQFVASGQAGLKSLAVDGHDDELVRLKVFSRGVDHAAGTVAGDGLASTRWGPFGYREADAMSTPRCLLRIPTQAGH